jgi:hypothetical protein
MKPNTSALVVALGFLIPSTMAADSTTVMRQLRAHLDRVRATAPPVESPDASDLSSSVKQLAGLSRGDLQQGLGQPTWCESSSKTTSCTSAQTWWFSFYKLPANTPGGGLELIVIFNKADRVESAELLHSQ